MTNLFRQPKGFYKNVFALMIPIVLQNLITHTVTLTDTFMVGMLGEEYLAATSAAATPMFFFIIFTFGVQSGAGILVAQYWGKSNTEAINRVLGVGLYFLTIITFAGAIVIALFPSHILGLITIDETLVAIGAPYARVVGFSQALNSISMIYVACQRSMENARLGVVVLSISSVFNIFGNWVLIFGKLGLPAMGIMGAAVATLCSRVLEVIIVVIYAFKSSRLPLKIAFLLKPGMVIFKDFVKYSLPVLFNEALWGFGMMLFPVIFGHMTGAQSILAAYTIAGNLERVFAVAVFASAAATAVIIGREIGAGRKDTVESVAKSLVSLGFIIGLFSSALLMTAIFTVLEPFAYKLFNLSKEASNNATIMLTILSCLIPIRTIGFTMGVGVLRGGGDVKALMYIDVCTLYVISLPFAAITGLILKADISIVYSSIILEEVIKTFLLVLRVKSRKWIKDVTREQI